MSLPRVCILTSGLGTRMGKLSELTNKALFPVGGKAIVSQIIEKFPVGTEFVISLGHLADHVKSYLSLAHPNIKFHFATVDNYSGPGSGPAYSLMCCKPNLPGPFYFVSCDTMWNSCDLTPSDRSWFASTEVSANLLKDYCTFTLQNSQITEIVDKQPADKRKRVAFSGLCYIADAETFWTGLNSKKEIKGELQISNGIGALLQKGTADVRMIDWIDVGDEQKYKEAVKRFDSEFDFSKTDELLYFVGSRVIKYFKDAKVTQARFERANQNPKVFPALISHAAGFYGYEMVPGKTLYARNNPKTFSNLLGWLSQNLWKPVAVEQSSFRSACETFYKKKTLQRIQQYQDKYNVQDRPAVVNGTAVPTMAETLSKIPWEFLFEGKPVFFHGDLQFDNILCRDDKGENFCLIDWRQDFAGHLNFGDLYYDLAKMWGGINLNYDYIKRNLFTYQHKLEDGKDVEFIDWATRTSGPEMEKILFSFVEKQGLSAKKIRLLTALIYLNMSPLHHEPFDQFLYALGRKKMTEVLAEF